MLSNDSDKNVKNREFAQAMYGYIIFMSWIGFFCLGIFVNEVFTNYSFCKKNNNKTSSQTIDSRHQVKETILSKEE